MSVSVLPLTVPATPFIESGFAINRRQAAGVFGSGRDVVIDRGIAQWVATLKTRPLFASEIGQWLAFKAALRGGQRFCLLSDPFRPYPAAYMPAGWGSLTRAAGGSFDGNATLSAIANSGLPGVGRDVVSLSGLPASLKLIAGDYVSFAQAVSLLVGQYDFGNAAWNKTGTTVTTNTTAAPDGTTTADTLTRTSATASFVGQAVAKTAAGIPYTFSADAKISSGNFFPMTLKSGSGGRADVCFNLSTSAISLAASATGPFAAASASIEAMGGGWQRCTLQATSDTHTDIDAYLSSSSVSQAVDGAGSANSTAVFVWDANLRQTGAEIVSLHQVLDQVQVTADGSGNITVWVEPEIPAQIPAGALADLLQACGKFRLDPTKFQLPIQASGRNRPGQASFSALSTLL